MLFFLTSSQSCDWHQLHSSWARLSATKLQGSIRCHSDMQRCGCDWSNKILLEFNM